jgi:vacuolar-type H+-ATPase subunit E/Vma4
MSLDAILEAIQESGRTEIAKIEAQAQDQVKIIIAEAQAKAESIHKEARATKMSRAKRDEDRIRVEAQSQVQKLSGESNHAFISETLIHARERLANYRASSSFPAVVLHLTVEALDKLYSCLEKDEQIYLRASRLDQELLEPFLKIRYPDVIVKYDLNCWGGVIAQSADGHIVITNTLDERFERSKPHIQRHLAVWFERYKHLQD